MPPEEFGAALATFARLIAREVVKELRQGDMIDQAGSPLGSRRHAAAVRRRVSGAKGGALIAGRRLLLSREAIEEEIAALNARSRKLKPTTVPEPIDFSKRYGFSKAG